MTLKDERFNNDTIVISVIIAEAYCLLPFYIYADGKTEAQKSQATCSKSQS